MEARVVLQSLFDRFPDLALTEPPDFLEHFVLRGLHRLDVGW